MSTDLAKLDTRLELIDRANAALAEATTVQEAKDIRDTAQAVQSYLKQQAATMETQNHAAELKLRAERKLGELIPQTVRRPGQRDETLQDAMFAPPTLKELGVEPWESSRWQQEATVPDEEFESYVSATKERGDELTTVGLLRKAKELDAEARRAANADLVSDTPPLTGTYTTIVIDPPWDWGDEGDGPQFGRARPKYSTMPLAEIEALPVSDLADDNAHLYLWSTNRSLPKAFGLVEHWGFRYITCLTWAKPSFGMGNYFRGSTEHVLFGVKGSLPLLRKDVGTWFEAPRPSTEHSSKPPEFFDIVESCSRGPYLEMFARSERRSWTTWGAEA